MNFWKQAMQEARNVVGALRPASIAQLALPEVLEQLASEFCHIQPQTELAFDAETTLPSLTPEIQVTLYRAAQEALTNIRKHANASKVLVRLRYTAPTLELLVLDNGTVAKAEPAQQSGGGFGLLGLRERVALLGGEVQIASSPTGFRVHLQIPVVVAETPTEAVS